MDEDSMAYVLGISYGECAGMRGPDVVELYGFLQANPNLPHSPFG